MPRPPRDTESPRSFRPIPGDHDPAPNDLHSPCPPWYLHPTTEAKPSNASVNSPCQAQPGTRTKDPGAVTQPTREEGHSEQKPNGEHHPQKANGEQKANDEHHPPQRAAGGSGGSPPRKSTASHWRRSRKAPSIVRRRVATGANHPASRSSAFRRGPGTPAVMLRRGTRASI